MTSGVAGRQADADSSALEVADAEARLLSGLVAPVKVPAVGEIPILALYPVSRNHTISPELADVVIDHHYLFAMYHLNSIFNPSVKINLLSLYLFPQ